MTFDAGPLAEVVVRPAGDRWALDLSRTFAASAEAVWAMLTKRDEIARWAPYEADRDLDSEGEVTLTVIDGDQRHAMASRVITVEPGHLLLHTWGPDTLRWQLSPIRTSRRLDLSHTMDDREMLPKAAAGWHLSLMVADRMLRGRPIDPIRGRDALEYGWEELADAYRRVLA